MWEALYAAWVISEIGISLFTRSRRATPGHQHHDRGSLLILWPVILASISFGTWYGQAHAPDFFSNRSDAARVGIPLLVIGLVIRWVAIFKLGRRFTANVVIQRDQRVETSGLFRFVRHPSYTGLLIIFSGIALNTRSWIGAAIVIVPISLALLYRIYVEEAALSNAFGEEYRSYCRSTKRLIPGVF
jgi:protein-S-isoprenylcysteine O-methyltransferase Ste14